MANTTNYLEEGLSMAEGNAAVDVAGGEFIFYVKNGISDAKVECKTLGPENWLCQAVEDTAEELGLNNKKSNLIFYNEAGQSTTDMNMPLCEFGITEGSVLTIQPDGRVA